MPCSRTLTGLAVILGASCQFGLAAEPATVVLGGLRQVRASVAIVESEYRIEVHMLPVTCFDAVTNNRLNRDKARAYALQALAKHLNGKGQTRLLVSGARIADAEMTGKEFRLTLTAPRGGVSVESGTATTKRPDPAVEQIQFSNAFFTAKRDYLNTLDQLAAGWDADRQAAIGKDDDQFVHAIASIEENGVAQLRRLGEEITGHKLLLFNERDELLKAVEDRKTALLLSLKEAVRLHQARRQFTDLKLEKPFDDYLLPEPLLMEVTGAKIIRLPNGRTAVVGVASTVLKDDSPNERLRAERVCQSKGRAAVIGEQHGVQVAHIEQAKDRTVIVIEDGKEKAKSVSELLILTRSKVEGISRGLAPVGRWKSADGKVFYLAIGGIFDAEGNPVTADVK